MRLVVKVPSPIYSPLQICQRRLGIHSSDSRKYSRSILAL